MVYHLRSAQDIVEAQILTLDRDDRKMSLGKIMSRSLD
jgi:hypothetical protein